MTNTLILDLEWSITWKEFYSKTGDKTVQFKDGTPFEPNNRLASAGWCWTTAPKDIEYKFFHHKELSDNRLEIKENHKILQKVLDKTDILVGHNIGGDLMWLKECGFKYEGLIFDTMIFDYVKLRGGKKNLKLKYCCERRYIEMVHKDILGDYLDQGINTDEVPLYELGLYGRDDVRATYELYKSQVKDIKTDTDVQHMIPIIKATNEFSKVLREMEAKGARIDKKELLKVEESYRKRRQELKSSIYKKVAQLMGDTPVNIDSSQQKSQVLYGFKVTDKKSWKEYFNLGTETFGARAGKAKYKVRRSADEIEGAISQWTEPLKKTIAKKCKSCKGMGTIQLYKKDGNPRKNRNICHDCGRTGVIYQNSQLSAGLGITLVDYEHTAAGGGSTGKEIIDDMVDRRKELNLNDEQVEFLHDLQEYTSIKTYLTNFIEAIQRLSHGDILNVSFNQCTTATGRLSSTFHNMPRGNTFPIKKCIVSKFKNGKILNADYSGLEFRIAAILSEDAQAIQDIKDNVDVHTNTASVVFGIDFDKVTKEERQDAKPDTFKPLYGGKTGTKEQQAYYKWFLARYSQVEEVQAKWVEQALKYGQVYSPSGRIYSFPYAKKTKYGVTQFTKICNYNVQGFAFDCVMVSIIELNKEMKRQGLKAHAILTIHDSVVVDSPPEEELQVIECFQKIFGSIEEIIMRYYKVEALVPLEYELKSGANWMEGVEVTEEYINNLKGEVECDRKKSVSTG